MRALEEFSEQVSLSSHDRRLLQDVFRETTERHLTLLHQCNRAERSWEDVRLEMDQLWVDGSQTVRGILDEGEFAMLAAIAAKHGTALVLRQEVRLPEGDTELQPGEHVPPEPLLQ